MENLGEKDKESLADKASAPANAPYLRPCKKWPESLSRAILQGFASRFIHKTVKRLYLTEWARHKYLG